MSLLRGRKGERQCELDSTSCWMLDVLPAMICVGMFEIQKRTASRQKTGAFIAGWRQDFLFPDDVWEIHHVCVLFVWYSVWQQFMCQNSVSVRFCSLDNFMWSDNYYICLESLKAHVCGMCVIHWHSFFSFGLKYVRAHTAVLLNKSTS